jgi:hypothetical protein
VRPEGLGKFKISPHRVANASCSLALELLGYDVPHNHLDQPIFSSKIGRNSCSLKKKQLTSIEQRNGIGFEVMLPSACSFIVDVSCHCLIFSCRCSTLHVSVYMAIFRCV